MDLYLIRHAEALPLGEQGISKDDDRPLSPEGEAQARQLTGVFRRRGIFLDKVVASPLLRAHQTAVGMLAQWPIPAPQLVTSAELAPGAKRRALARFLRKQGGQSIALIGHLPDLGTFAAWLVGGKNAQIDMAKAGIAYINCPNEPRKSAGTLVWLVSPDWYTDTTDSSNAKESAS